MAAMSTEKDACMIDITQTQSTVELECSQIIKKRKKKRLERSWDGTGDSLPNDFQPENTSGGNDNCVNEAGVDANSKEISDRTQDMESVTLQDGVKKKKKRRKGFNTPQPAILLPPVEEGQLEKTGNISTDSLADISVTENGSGESVVHVSPGEVDAKSKISLSTAAELTFSPEGEKGRKKRKKDLRCPQPAEPLALKDEDQLDMIQKISTDSHAGVSTKENAVDGTFGRLNEDGIHAKSEKDMNTTQDTESAIFQDGGKEKEKRKKELNNSQPPELLLQQGNGCLEKAQNIGMDPVIISVTENTTNEKDNYVDEVKVDNNSKNDLSTTEAEELGTSQEGQKKKKKRKKARDRSQPTELISTQEGQLEKIENPSCYSQPENFEIENTIPGTGNHVNEAEELGTCHEGQKKKKKGKKARDRSQPTELISTQEGQLEKIENPTCYSQPENFEIENTIPGTGNHVNEAELNAKPTMDLSASHATELVTLQNGGKRKKKKNEVSGRPISTESIASQEQGTVDSTENVGSDPQANLSETKNTFSGKNCCTDQTEIDANPTKDLDRSQSSMLVALQEERKKRKKQKSNLNCSQPMQLPTSDEEGKRKKKRKKDSNSSGLGELHESQEEETVQKTQNISSDSQPGLSAKDNTSIAEHSSMNKTDIDANRKIDTNRSQATESIELQEEGKKRKKHKERFNCLEHSEPVTLKEGKKKKKQKNYMNDAQLVELSALQEGVRVKKKRKKDSQDLNPTELTVSPEGCGGTEPEPKQNIICQDEEDPPANGAEADLDYMKEITLTVEKQTGSACIAKGSTEMDYSNYSAGLVSVEDTAVDCAERAGIRVYSRKTRPLNGSIEFGPEPITRRMSGEHSCDGLMKDALSGGQVREEYTSVKAVEFGPPNFSKEDVAAEGIKMITEREDEVVKIAKRSLIDHSNDTQPTETVDMIPRKDLLVQQSTIADAVEMVGVKNDICLDDCLKENILEADGRKNKQTAMPKDEIMTSEGKEGGHVDVAVKTSVKAKENIGVVEAGSGSLIHANNVPTDKDDCIDEPGISSVELTNANDFLKKDEVRVRCIKSIKHDCSNGDPLAEHSSPLKGLELTIVKNTNSSSSDIDVSQKERETATKMMNGVNVQAPTERDNIPRALKTPLKGPYNVHAAKKLLILDVNGLLADIIPHSERPPSRKPDFNLRQKSVYRRPYCVDFLNFCFENFEVGVWSSRKRDNLDQVVMNLFGSLKRHLLFCWDRSRCTISGLATVDNSEKPLVLKELKRLWDWNQCPWRRGYFDASNTLLLDDSPYKALRNPVHTAIFPHSYKCTDDEDSALGPEGDIRKYLERLMEAPNVQEFISQNPFGQKPIRASDPSWPFYRKIIIGGNN